MLDRSDDLRWRRYVPIFKPLNAVVLRRGFRGNIAKVWNEDLKSGVDRHTSVAAGELRAIINQIQIEPWIVGNINDHDLDRMHAEAAEVNCAPLQAEEIAPQLHTLHIIRSLAVDGLYVRAINAYPCQSTADMRRGQQFMRVK